MWITQARYPQAHSHNNSRMLLQHERGETSGRESNQGSTSVFKGHVLAQFRSLEIQARQAAKAKNTWQIDQSFITNECRLPTKSPPRSSRAWRRLSTDLETSFVNYKQGRPKARLGAALLRTAPTLHVGQFLTRQSQSSKLKFSQARRNENLSSLNAQINCGGRLRNTRQFRRAGLTRASKTALADGQA